MTEIAETVDTYLAMWNETDAAKRAELIERAWMPGGRYLDPVLQAAGYEELGAMVAGVQEQFPGHQFRRTSGIDLHHDCARFAWELVGPDGTVAVAGIDIAVVAPDGRLAQVTGFFGELPQEAAA